MAVINFHISPIKSVVTQKDDELILQSFKNLIELSVMCHNLSDTSLLIRVEVTLTVIFWCNISVYKCNILIYDRETQILLSFERHNPACKETELMKLRRKQVLITYVQLHIN